MTKFQPCSQFIDLNNLIGLTFTFTHSKKQLCCKNLTIPIRLLLKPNRYPKTLNIAKKQPFTKYFYPEKSENDLLQNTFTLQNFQHSKKTHSRKKTTMLQKFNFYLCPLEIKKNDYVAKI